MSAQKIQNLADLKKFAAKLTGEFGPRQILLLKGPVGAGKTQLVRFLLEALGSHETTSPSFAIHNAYETSRGTVDHIDLYRLENEDELESTGFWDLFSQPQGLIIIEWAERLDLAQLPPNWARLHVEIEITGAETRTVHLT